MQLAIVSAIVFVIAVLMTMVGRGGGNFYVLVQVFSGQGMHHAAATGQFIMFFTALAGFFVFRKHKLVSWPLALFIGGTTSLMALVGGLAAGSFTSPALKLFFAVMLVLVGVLMLVPVKEATEQTLPSGPGFWLLKTPEATYVVNLWLALPVTLATGFVAGLVGVSGGSFLVPLLVLACRVPMRLAVGTASTMVAATALMGFTGHALHGEFSLWWALPQALAAAAGGVIGGHLTLRTKPKRLKLLFALTTLAAAVLVIINVLWK